MLYLHYFHYYFTIKSGKKYAHHNVWQSGKKCYQGKTYCSGIILPPPPRQNQMERPLSLSTLELLQMSSLKALLHCAFFSATCLAMVENVAW